MFHRVRGVGTGRFIKGPEADLIHQTCHALRRLAAAHWGHLHGTRDVGEDVLLGT